MATSSSFSIRESCKEGLVIVDAVTPLESDGVVRNPAVQLLRVEVAVEPLRVRVRDRMCGVSLSGFEGVECGEEVLLVVMSHWVIRPDL